MSSACENHGERLAIGNLAKLWLRGRNGRAAGEAQACGSGAVGCAAGRDARRSTGVKCRACAGREV